SRNKVAVPEGAAGTPPFWKRRFLLPNFFFRTDGLFARCVPGFSRRVFIDMLSRDCNAAEPPLVGRRRGPPARAGGRFQVNKGARGMPRLPEAMKDAPSCDNPRGSAQAI